MTSLQLEWGRVVRVWWSWAWRLALYSLTISIIVVLLAIAAFQEASIVSPNFLELFLGVLREQSLRYPEEIHLGFWDLLIGLAFLLAYFLALKRALEIHVPLIVNASAGDEPAPVRKRDQDGGDRPVSQHRSTSKPAKNREQETTKLRLTWVRVVLVWWSWVWRSFLYLLTMGIIVLLIGIIVLLIAHIIAPPHGGALTFFPDVQSVLAKSLTIFLFLVLLGLFLVLFWLVSEVLPLKRALEIHVPLIVNASAGDEPAPPNKRDKDGDDHLVG